ncbi:MAG: hypothetical protein JNK04_14775, partial [Myxococcales bacterium]|nr:hypothetical protein [Myxococcales bacterium]
GCGPAAPPEADAAVLPAVEGTVAPTIAGNPELGVANAVGDGGKAGLFALGGHGTAAQLLPREARSLRYELDDDHISYVDGYRMAWLDLVGDRAWLITRTGPFSQLVGDEWRTFEPPIPTAQGAKLHVEHAFAHPSGSAMVVQVGNKLHWLVPKGDSLARGDSEETPVALFAANFAQGKIHALGIVPGHDGKPAWHILRREGPGQWTRLAPLREPILSTLSPWVFVTLPGGAVALAHERGFEVLGSEPGDATSHLSLAKLGLDGAYVGAVTQLANERLFLAIVHSDRTVAALELWKGKQWYWPTRGKLESGDVVVGAGPAPERGARVVTSRTAVYDAPVATALEPPKLEVAR